MSTTQALAIGKLLAEVAERRASDLHLTVGNPPVLRIDGQLKVLPDEPIVTPDLLAGVLTALLTPEQRTRLEADRELTLTVPFENRARFKVTAYHQKGFVALSLRLISATVPTIADLGLPAIVDTFADMPRGLVLATGPFGSGRTSTVAAIVQAINDRRAVHIVTVEQPIEYLFQNNRAIIEQREVGTDTKSFVQAVETANHEDVDVMLLSELADAETIRAALSAVASGRLVLSTMTTESVLKTIERILLSFPATELPSVRLQLAEHLRGVVSQRLLPRVGGGRVAATEILVPNEPVRAVLREGSLYQLQNILHTSRDEGMVPLDRSLADLVRTGAVLLEDALPFAADRGALRQFAAR